MKHQWKWIYDSSHREEGYHKCEACGERHNGPIPPPKGCHPPTTPDERTNQERVARANYHLLNHHAELEAHLYVTSSLEAVKDAMSTFAASETRLLSDRIGELEEEVADYERLMWLERDAERRAIEQWRSEKPEERRLRLPDRANFVLWLLNRIEFDEAVYAELTNQALEEK